MNTKVKRQRFWGLVVVVLASLLTAVASLAAVPSVQQAKLIVSDGAALDIFGFSVALDGDTALVGAPSDDDLGFPSGSAYVFTHSSGVWTQQAKLTASDGVAFASFGVSVAISGDTALVGALTDDLGTDSGSVYVFTRLGSIWTQQAKLTASDGAANDWFGRAVALDGDTALVGGGRDDDLGTDSGSAYVFTRSGGVWTQQAKLTASDGAAGDFFSIFAVALDGDTALVGAFGDDDNGPQTGSVYVFARSGGIWTQQAKLTASDGAAGDDFGSSVALDGDTALSGALGDDDLGTNSGSAYIFTRLGGVWTQQAKLTASDGAAGDLFSEPVALDGDTALVGARLDDDLGTDSGSAYVFVGSGSVWTQQAKLTASDGAAGDRFGTVALDGNTALVGAIGDDSFAGSAYIFGPPNQPPTADAGGAYSGGEASAIALTNASASDPDGDSLTLAWTVDSALCIFSDAATLNPTLTCNDNGSFTATLTVSDGMEIVSSQATVTVNNVAPTISSVSNDGPVIVNENATITISASDPAGANDPLMFYFDCDNDGVYEIGPQASSSAFCPFNGTGDSCPLNGAGVFTVNVQVSDDDGGVTAGATAVTALSPQQAIADLGDEVRALMDASVLNHGQGTSLLSKLRNASKWVDDQGEIDPDQAIHQLQLFIDQVNTLIASGVLTPAEGQALIDAANRIIASLNLC